MKLVGILLVIAGVLAFTYGGFSYLRQNRVLEAGPLQISWRQSVPIPPIVGIGAVIVGGVMLIAGSSRRRHA